MRKLKSLHIKDRTITAFQLTPQEFAGMYKDLERFLVMPDGRIIIWNESSYITHDQLASTLWPKVFETRYDAYKNLPTKGYMRGVIGQERTGEKVLFFDLACREKGLDVILAATEYLPGKLKTIATEYDCDGKIMHGSGFEGRLSELRGPTKTARELLGRGGPEDVYDGFSVYSNPPDSAAFKKWFGKSKVVDDSGQPVAMYHGTASIFSSFSDKHYRAVNRGYWGNGFFFTPNKQVAEGYAEKASELLGGTPRIVTVYLVAKNPEYEDFHPYGNGSGVIDSARQRGKDSLFLVYPHDHEKAGLIAEIAVFSPDQIKIISIEDLGSANPAKVRPESAYDPAELAIGIKVEAEHTNSAAIASKIARQHLEETPDYYSKLIDAGLADNPGDLPISGVIHELVKKFNEENKTGDACGINAGHCDLFGEAIYHAMGGLKSGVEVLEVSVPEDEDDEADYDWPYHVFVKYRGKYYDAEAPDGVKSMKDLPIFQKWIKKVKPTSKLEVNSVM